MRLSLFCIAPLYLALLLTFIPTCSIGKNIPVDSTSQVTPLTPLPLKIIPLFISKKENTHNNIKVCLKFTDFAIANPSQQQISEWLAGDFANLNHLFSEGDPKAKGDLLSETTKYIGKARETIQKVKAAGNFVTRLTGEDLQTLPVGMSKQLGDNSIVTVGVSNIFLYPAYASLEIYVEVTSPNFPTPLFFAAPDIKFSRLGGLSGMVSLGLLGDFTLPVFEEKATIRLRSAMVDTTSNEFKQDQGTYAEFSCDGIETISIDANLAISRSVILPASNLDTEPGIQQDTSSVSADFFVASSNGLSDIITEISFDQPFYHVQNDKFIWTIQSAVLDFSTLSHRNSLQFPVVNYDPMPRLATKENWKGVYIKEIDVEWREKFSNDPNEPGRSFSISGEDIIIDEAGFTGRISAENIIPLNEEYEIDKWAFSIDYLEISILTNTFESLDFSGSLGIPMTYPDDNPSFDKEDLIAYSASFDFSRDKYFLSGNLPTDKVLPLKMLKGQIVIYNTSTFTIGYDEDNILLSANLNTSFEVKGSQDSGEDKELKLPLVQVSGLEVSSKAPYLIAPGNWVLSDTISVADFGGFGLNISMLALQKNAQTNEAELIIGADINLAAGDKINISGATVLRVVGNIENTPTKQKWKFKKIKLDMIQVAADMEAFSIVGQVVFFENLDDQSSSGQLGYGSGFQGSASLKLKGLNKDSSGGSGFSAMALFGTATDSENETFRYFMVDVMGYFSTGIPLGPIGLYGIGGGVYYRMEQEAVDANFNSIPDFEPPAPTNVNAYTAYISSFLGKSLSGKKYMPSETVKIGISLNVILGSTPSPKAFNTNIGLTMEFNNNGGLNFIRLNGILNAMTDISMEGPSCSGVSLAIEMEFVFNTTLNSNRDRTGFYASAHAFVKVGPLSGSNSADNIPDKYRNYISRCSSSGLGYAGGLEMQFSPGYWFLNVGTPESRLGLQINLWKLGAIRLQAYFDIGKNIPAFPGLPPNVSSLTRMGNLLQNENTRASGQGFAFGISFDASLDTPQFLGFSAHVAMGAGFDIMLNKFRDVNCLNSGSPEPIGVNNWYAAGQAWAYIDAGIRFKGVEILGVGLAAALQIKGPNPTFGRGALAGRLTLGIFKKKFNIHFQFGKECEIQGNQSLEQEIPIVLFMTPSNDDQEVSISTEIDVVFSQELNTVFQSFNPNTEENESFKIQLESFEITDSDGNPINVTEERLSRQFYRYLPVDQLRSYTEYTLTLVAKLFRSNGQLVETEERIHIFKTGKLPTEIFPTNINYAIPGDGQFNYYKNDNNSQTIQLIQGQEELLAELPEGQVLKIKLSTTHPASFSYTACDYNSETNQLNFSLPSNLINGKSYKLELVNIPNNEFSNYSNTDNFDLDEFNLPSLFEEEIVYYSMAFRVSNYDSFENKMEAISFSSFIIDPSAPTGFLSGYAREHLVQVNNLSEPFGIEELDGVYDNDPSLLFEADLTATQWITNNYQNYAGPGISNTDVYGYSNGDRISYYLEDDRVEYFGDREPAKAIFIVQDSAYQSRVDQIFSNNNGTNFFEIDIKINYALGNIMAKELQEISNFLINQAFGSFDINMFVKRERGDTDEFCFFPDNDPVSTQVLKMCCLEKDGTYNSLKDFVRDNLNAGKGTLRKFAYAPNSRSVFCDWDINGIHKRNLFTDLVSGNYPFYIKYYSPTSITPRQTFNKTFIKN